MTDAVDPLAAVLDELLPAHGEVPAAGALGLASRVRDDAARVAALRAALEQTLAELPDDFAERAPSRRVAWLRELERDRPRVFAGLINLAYNAYYTDPAVLRGLEATTGYAAGAPQPDGYELAPFDERALAAMRRRAPSWRRP